MAWSGETPIAQNTFVSNKVIAGDSKAETE
jgi:hypothetical protein